MTRPDPAAGAARRPTAPGGRPGSLPRVIHLGPDPSGPGGMPAVVRGLIESPLSERYAQRAIATYRPGSAWRRHSAFVTGMARLIAACLRPGPLVLHVHTAVRGSIYRKAIVILVGRALRRPVLLQLHAGVGDIERFDAGLGDTRRALLRFAVARADARISVSSAGGAEFAGRFGLPAMPVIPNAAPRVARAGGAAPADGIVRCLYLGGFDDPAKGGAVLVSALAAMLAAEPSLRVDLAGPGEPTAELGALAAADGARVRWLGWLGEEQKGAAFEAADVVIMPSLTEGLPVALLEAMAYGRAIVASRAGGMPEVVADDREAVLVTPGDAAELTERTVALARDPERRRARGAAARDRARSMTDDEVCRPLGELYEQLLAGRRD
jgi:glycosyltransferase involved in cell wall biosynthesis